jgi:hypothetical protein
MTMLACNTGSFACIEAINSGQLTLKNLNIRCSSGMSSPCVFGIALLRGQPACLNEGIALDHVTVMIDHNSRNSSVGLYNVASERMEVTGNSVFWADTPIILSQTNVNSYIPASQVTLTGCSQSTTLINFFNTGINPQNSNSGPGILSNGAANITLVNTNMVGNGTAQPYVSFECVSCADANGHNSNANWNFINSSFETSTGPYIATMANMDHIQVNSTFNPATSHQVAFQWGANSLTCNDCYFNLQLATGAGTAVLMNNANSGEVWAGGEISMGGMQALTATNTQLKSVTVRARGLTASKINFAPGSVYTLYDDTESPYLIGGTTADFISDNSMNRAQSGSFRCGNNAPCLKGRNAGNTADLQLIAVGGNNVSLLGDATGVGLNGPNNLLLSPTAPTISSGFGTRPSIISSNGTAAFQINIGTGGAATSGVIGLPKAAHGWWCKFDDVTTQSSTAFVTKQIASSTTSATIANFNTSGAQAAWASGDLLNGGCVAF